MRLIERFYYKEDILSVMREGNEYIAEYYGYNSGRYYCADNIKTYFGALRVLVQQKREVIKAEKVLSKILKRK